MDEIFSCIATLTVVNQRTYTCLALFMAAFTFGIRGITISSSRAVLHTLIVVKESSLDATETVSVEWSIAGRAGI